MASDMPVVVAVALLRRDHWAARAQHNSPFPFNAHKYVLMLRRSESNPIGAGRWHIPGGKVEPAESLEAAARREMKQVVGVEFDAMVHLTTRWSTAARLELFACHYGDGDYVREPRAIEKGTVVQWVHVDKMQSMPKLLQSVVPHQRDLQVHLVGEQALRFYAGPELREATTAAAETRAGAHAAKAVETLQGLPAGIMSPPGTSGRHGRRSISTQVSPMDLDAAAKVYVPRRVQAGWCYVCLEKVGSPTSQDGGKILCEECAEEMDSVSDEDDRVSVEETVNDPARGDDEAELAAAEEEDQFEGIDDSQGWEPQRGLCEQCHEATGTETHWREILCAECVDRQTPFR